MYDGTSDGALIERTAGGDRAAFEALYRRYSRAVFGLALRRLGDRGRAEEAMQETFASVWRSASSYRPERGRGAAWLYAVARNAIVDRARTRVEPTAEHPDEPAADAGPGEQAESAWISWRVHRALEELPEGDREALTTAYWSGAVPGRAASADVPLDPVRARSALGRLAAVLDSEEFA